MITGYNTDVNHANLTFHVQTEDKGTSNHYIESLIYVGGLVLAAKRTDYKTILQEGKTEEIIAIMDRQHKAMIGAVKSGEYDAKVIELFGDKAPGPKKKKVADTSLEGDGATSAAVDRSLDEVILEYLTNEASQEHLVLLLEDEVELAFGHRTPVKVRTSSSKTGEPVPEAQVTLKMISTVSEPVLLASGQTDGSGVLDLEIEIPEAVQGSTALIINANSALGRAELKYLL